MLNVVVTYVLTKFVTVDRERTHPGPGAKALGSETAVAA